MIYRKVPAHPARLLLRIAKVTSGAVLAAACGGAVDSTSVVGGGMYCSQEPDGGSTCGENNPDASAGGGFVIDSGTNPCADNGCGLVASFDDAGNDASSGDAGETDGATGGGIIGVIVNLDAGDDDASTGVVGTLPNP